MSLSKFHRPAAAHAALWHELATLSLDIGGGASRAWHELAKVVERIEGKEVTIFGEENRDNCCVQLLDTARKVAHSLTPFDHHAALKAAADAVLAAYYDWEGA